MSQTNFFQILPQCCKINGNEKIKPKKQHAITSVQCQQELTLI